MDNKVNKKKNRITIIAMALAFITPMLIAAILINTTSDWMSWSRKNTGTLVHPAHTLTPFELIQQKNGEALNLETIQGKWNVIYIGGSVCDDVCKDVLYKTRQSRLAKGKEMHRIRRIYVLNDKPGNMAELKKFLAEQHPDLILVTGDEENQRALIEQFKPDGQMVKNRIYLVDPLGNFMMFYEADFPAKGLIKDLGRLLYVSQIG
jgi:cytochrome oxidase Cu insertion factor (SCO1/SenC/PrrC family)